MDLQTAAPSRRSLLGIAGVAGAVAAVATGRSVLAAPNRPSQADADVLASGMSVELAVSDLYALAVAAGVSESAFATIAANHRAYAEAIAATIGRSATGRDDQVYDQFEAQFDSSDTTAVAAAAATVEQVLAASHLQLVGQFEGTDPVALVTSILVVEGRHATVLTDIAGQGDDLEALLGPIDDSTSGGGST